MIGSLAPPSTMPVAETQRMQKRKNNLLILTQLRSLLLSSDSVELVILLSTFLYTNNQNDGPAADIVLLHQALPGFPWRSFNEMYKVQVHCS
jgi:hypothetical protein